MAFAILMMSAFALNLSLGLAADTCVSGKPRKEDWVPVLRFDGGAGSKCFPDYATRQRNGICKGFSNDAPVYYEEKTCSTTSYKIAYWWFYGWQGTCAPGVGSHDKDWEHVILEFSKSGNTYCLKSVRFHQHGDYYTRRIGKFEIENNRRVVVYVGKNAHGSYHMSCKWKVCCIWHSDYCPGGCGYWDDFRNPSGNKYKFTSTTLLHIDSPDVSVRKTGGRDYCTSATCTGADARLLTSSGCWQDEP